MTSDPLGRQATRPWRMGARAWWLVLERVWTESGNDNIGLIAAGVAFYGFLSIVPTIAAMLLIYGLFAPTTALVATISEVSSHLPADAASVVIDQLMDLASTSDARKGGGLTLALAIALFGATKGVDALVTAITLAYDETEERSWLRRTLTVVALTVFAILFGLIAFTVIGTFNLPLALLPSVSTGVEWLIALGSAILLMATGAATAAVFYRYAPDRTGAAFAWLTPGAAFTGIGWVASTSLLAVYVSNIADYGATWGSLAGVVVLLTWLYLSAYILLLGAELNAELEHQTARDTTTGREKPMGQRGAVVADTLA